MGDVLHMIVMCGGVLLRVSAEPRHTKMAGWTAYDARSHLPLERKRFLFLGTTAQIDAWLGHYCFIEHKIAGKWLLM